MRLGAGTVTPQDYEAVHAHDMADRAADLDDSRMSPCRVLRAGGAIMEEWSSPMDSIINA